MKPTGNIVYNMGDKIIDGSMLLVPYRFALRVLEDYNLRLVNDITWVKSNPTPHQFSRRLIASTEPFFILRLVAITITTGRPSKGRIASGVQSQQKNLALSIGN